MEEESSPKSMNKAIIGLIVVVLLVAVAAAVFAISSSVQPDDSNPVNLSKNSNNGNANSSEKSSADEYVDGEYKANGSYVTPGGTESIDLMVTLKDGTIESAKITQNAITGEARQFQSQFASGFEAEVVGKDIESVNLSRVAGSSLTPIGFNAALETIKSDARA